MHHTATRRIAILTSFVLLSGCASVAPSDRETAVDTSRTLVAEIADELLLDIPAGEVDIGPSADDLLRVDLTYYCAADSEKCIDMAGSAEIIHTISDGRSTISFEPDSAFATRHADVVYRFQVPGGRSVTVDLGAGDLEVQPLESCVSAVVGAGDVNITQSARNVRSVMLDANVGDATLRHPDGRVDNQRKLLVGAEVSWTGSRGHCHSRVKLQAGDISYRLTD